MSRLAYWVARAGRGAAKVAAGLAPFNESVWPGAANDLFVAHLSIYEYFARHVSDRTVLDLGCGTGYGVAVLKRAGARSVTGVDIDERSLRYARRRFGADGVRFVREDLETMAAPGRFDTIVSSNAFEHLDDPVALLSRAVDWLEPDGEMILALPPILSEHDVPGHAAIHYHRNITSVDGWLEIFGRCGLSARTVAHRPASGETAVDLTSPFRTSLRPDDFIFVDSSRDDIYASGAITVLFHLQPARSSGS